MFSTEGMYVHMSKLQVMRSPTLCTASEPVFLFRSYKSGKSSSVQSTVVFRSSLAPTGLRGLTYRGALAVVYS